MVPIFFPSDGTIIQKLGLCQGGHHPTDLHVGVFCVSLPRVEAIYIVSDRSALQDRQVASLIQYAMNVEKTMFETAVSKAAYYQLLVEKIYRIKSQPDERWRMMERRKQLEGS